MKKFRRQITNNKENVTLAPELMSNPINSKINKFGKSIREKALQTKSVNTNISTNCNNYNFLDHRRRQSAETESQTILIPKVKKLSASLIIPDESSFIQGSLTERRKCSLSKSKNVRFSETEEPQPSTLKSVRRSSCSILKNSQSFDKLSINSTNSHMGEISGGLSAKGSLKDKGASCQNKKYEAALKLVVQGNKKYFDDLFPPGSASLFYSKAAMEMHKDIKWVRIDEVFKGKNFILWSHENRNLVLNGQFPSLDYMATCFNAIGSSARCIERIFEDQQYNKYGIYYLRLNHEGIWKYIVVDDYIPVIKKGRQNIPIFLSTKSPKSNSIQLWPFLLQKAIAKMYSCYESLMNDSVQNFIQELTGIVPETHLTLESSSELKLRNTFMNHDNIVIGKNNRKNSLIKENFYPIVEDKPEYTYFNEEANLKLLPADKESSPFNIQMNNIKNYFSSLSIYTIDDSYFSVGCIIKQQKNSISLRKVKIETTTNCNISLIQKDHKYYRSNGYQYSWMRLIIAAKDIDGYRFIDGVYGKNKIINCLCTLTPGQYFFVVMGDWNKKVFDVTLNYQGNSDVQIQRQSLSKYPNIIQQIGTDLAQRFGVCKQVHKNICSYQYIDTQNGFIIENLNNQCNRKVYINKEYKFDKRILQNIGAPFAEEGNLQTFIKPDSSLTVILKFTNGINYQFLKEYAFL